MKHVLPNQAVLYSDRQLDLLELILSKGSDGITFKELFEKMKNRPRNDAGVRMSLDRLEELRLVRREPRRKYGIRGRFQGTTIKWFPLNGREASS